MRGKQLALLAGLFTALGVAVAPAQERTVSREPSPVADSTSDVKRWDAIFNFETSYFSGSVSPKVATVPGNAPIPDKTKQVITPFGLQTNWRPTDDLKITSTVRSSYMWSRQISDVEAAEFHSLLDTSVSTQMTYLGFAGFQPFVQFAVNIPTGQTLFSGTKSNNVKPDLDVTGRPSFGEGWNYGATAGVNIPVSAQLMTSYGIGYTSRGSFKRECATGACNFNPDYDMLNPGDVVTGNATAAYRGERLSASVSISYSTETITRVNDEVFFQAGDRIFVAAGVGYAWTEQLATRLTGSYSHTAKNKVNDGVNNLMVEQFNTNSNVYTVNLSTSYRDGRSTYGPVIGFLYRDKNGWDSTDQQYLSAKTKWTAGWILQHALNANMTLTSRVEHMWIKEGERTIIDMPELDSRIWVVTVGGVFRY